MSKTISKIKDDLSRKFKGASIDDVRGISDYSVFGEAASNMLLNIDPLETIRHDEVNIFQDVHDYTSPANLKGKKIIDFRPQVNRVPSDNFDQTYIEDLDRDRENQTFSVEFDEGTKFTRVVDRTLTGSIQATRSESADWTAGTGVSNITEDTILFSEAGKSIRFDITSGTSDLTWAGTAFDLSDHQEKSSFFMNVYWPDSSLITSITVRVGSDSSNYWEITGTIHFGSVRTGWNLYRFDWNGATQTGTVDEANTDYVNVRIVSTANDTDIRIGALISRLPYPREWVYYTDAMFRSSAGAWLTVPTADTDVLVLEKEAEIVFLYECCQIVASDMSRDTQKEKFNRILHGDGNEVGLYGRYKNAKPGEAIRPKTRYYRPYRHHINRGNSSSW